MKNKIFNRLKQEYAHLGLDDNFLLGLAESLANSGYVTDENIEGVVTAQKAYLEAVQKSNDKRVQDAVEKVTKTNEEQATKIADLEKKLKEAKEGKQTPSGDNNELLEFFKQEKAEREKREQEFREKIESLEKAKADTEKEKAAAAAAAAAAERAKSIEEKAKAKGIPDYIIKRGFGSLPADADDAAVDVYLSEYAQELKTNLLPGKNSLPQIDDLKADKAETDAMVDKLFPSAKKEEK